MIKDYSKQVSEMDDWELSKRMEEIGKTEFVGGDNDEWRFYRAMWCEKYKRDNAEKEFLSREEILRFDLMELE